MAVAPFKIEVWSADGNSRILNMTVSIDAAQRVYQEALANLRTGDTIRVRDANGALVLSSDVRSYVV
jgi:hypothetical protein